MILRLRVIKAKTFIVRFAVESLWESAIAQMGERKSSVLLSELHTNWVRVRASMYFHTGWRINDINLALCMWSCCRRADSVVSQAYSGMPRYVLYGDVRAL